MALIVEDGSGLEDANSYVSVVEFQAWLTSRGYTVTGDEEILLLQSMDFLESLDLIGHKKTKEQALHFPAFSVSIDGWCYRNDEIPYHVKKAQMQIAYSIDQGYGPLAVQERGIKREKIDVLEIEYMDGASINDVDPNVYAVLRKITGGGIGMLKVERA